jgi:TRAP-type mannitol/chloroaromatic compound transport system permease small subunit
MDEPPKRTRAEMIGQLLVILVLMAVLVGAIVFLHDYVTSHSSAPASARVLHSAVVLLATAQG